MAHQEWTIVIPLDTDIPMDRSLTIPQERQPHEKPNQFTQRLVEFRLHSKLPELKAVHAQGGPYPKEYMEKLQQDFYKNIDAASPQFCFEGADRTWDRECPWLKPQREYVQSTTWLILVVAHRPYIFSVPQCRTEVLKAGIKVLQAQERNYRCLGKEFWKLFTLAFVTLEAATAIMAVLIAFPAENGDLIPAALFQVRESIARLKVIGDTNHFAVPAAEVLQSLMSRVEGMDALTGWFARATSVTDDTAIQNYPAQYQTQGSSFDFNSYGEVPTVAFPQSGASNSSPNFDVNFGGVVDTFAPTSNMVDGDLTTAADSWDPMILMGWTDMVTTGDGGMGYYGGNDLEQNNQQVVT